MNIQKKNCNTVLITGGAGFIGSHVADFLIENGNVVTIIDDLSFGKMENVNPKADFHKIDIRDINDTERLIIELQPHVIFHFAANATTKSSAMGWKDPVKDYLVNMAGTLNLLEIMRKQKLDCHLIYTSSAAVYGPPEKVPINENHPTFPVSPYGISKLAGEKYCYAYFKEYGINMTVMRIFNTVGPRQPRYVLYDQIKQMIEGPEKLTILGTGEQVRDYTDITDTVKAFSLVMNNSTAFGEIFNVAGGNKISIKELIKLTKSVLNIDIPEYYTGKSWKGDIDQLWADTSKIRDVVGWKPEVDLEESIRKLAAWMQCQCC